MNTAPTYQELAQQHRPQNPALIAAEARRLMQDGLRPRDVASALNMPFSEAIALLADAQS